MLYFLFKTYSRPQELYIRRKYREIEREERGGDENEQEYYENKLTGIWFIQQRNIW